MFYQQVTNNKWFSFWVNWYNKHGWKTESKNEKKAVVSKNCKGIKIYTTLYIH
jgi:hypothetical protein